MRECPKCQTTVDGLICQTCGFREEGAPSFDPSRHLCVHVERGQRCANAGSLTANLYPHVSAGTAHPGPFYCHLHFPPFVHWGRQDKRVPPKGGFERIRHALRRTDPEAVAEREAIQTECTNTGA